MEHNLSLIFTLASGLTVALILGYIAQKIKLSPLVGYLIAGILVSPHSPGIVANIGIAQQCAEIGVVLLMFGVGMHFKLTDLVAVKNIAVIGALTQISISTIISAILVNMAFSNPLTSDLTKLNSLQMACLALISSVLAL